jgi:hypothetical protein
MWKEFGMLPRVFYSLLWSSPIWLFLYIQGQNLLPSAIIDVTIVICISFLIEYGILHKWMKSQENKSDRHLRLDRLTIYSLLSLLCVLGFLLLLITATRPSEELQIKAGLMYVYLILISTHTACSCTRYQFRRYGTM